jgi:N-methylhydantoinase B
VRTDGSSTVLLKGEASVRAGDRVLLFTAGGGGFGDPAQRSPESAADDLAQGYVTQNQSSGPG